MYRFSVDFAQDENLPVNKSAIDLSNSRQCDRRRISRVSVNDPSESIAYAFLPISPPCVCRCCDNGVTCQFALLLFVEERERECVCIANRVLGTRAMGRLDPIRGKSQRKQNKIEIDKVAARANIV